MRPGDSRLKLKQFVAVAAVAGGLGLSAVGLDIGMAHAVPTSPSPAPTQPTKQRQGPNATQRPTLPSRINLPPAIPGPLVP